MKGIILAGGTGSRLFPLTMGVSKHLFPIYDKPMIYYPLSVLMLADIREILIITTPEDQANYKRLLGNGKQWGISIEYCIQTKPKGLAEAFILGKSFIGQDSVCLVLGDNVFWGHTFSAKLQKAREIKDGAVIFGYQVIDPERFGVVELDRDGYAISLAEKPKKPKSNLAVTGLYFYDNDVINIAHDIQPSDRGELEITSINEHYLNHKKLHVEILSRGFAWLDTGTHSSLLDASKFVETIEKQQGYKIACLEEIAWLKKWINTNQLQQEALKYTNNNYGQYLLRLIN